MGEITPSMERKWTNSITIPATIPATPTAFEVLYHCPCFHYIQFLLGGRPYVQLPKKNLLRLIKLVRFFVPTLLLMMFATDFGDWLINGEAAMKFQQTRIISMLTYLDSQFGLWLGTATTFIFMYKGDRLLHCAESLGMTMKLLDMLPFPESGPKRPFGLKVAWVILSVLSAFSLFRGIYGVWEAIDPTFLYEPRIYFLWLVPKGIIAAVLKTFFLLSELSALPIYVVFTYVCAKFTRCFQKLNKGIGELIERVERQEFKQPFVEQLKELSLKEVTLAQSVIDLDDCFAVQVLFFVVNNSLGVFSKIAKCFIASAFINWIDYVKFVMKSSMYVLGLAIIIVFPAMLHESSNRSNTLWQKLIAVRQEKRQKDYSPEEGEVLITLLQRTTFRQHSLTVAGMANLTRSFGVTLLLGFAGFTCFLIDRAENYKVQEISFNSTCNCTLFEFNDSVV
ncbi:uncharacterized protein LOC129588456 [Paramacrobiotus metropolitanus]|uniref:uncharacterized protein LOC129588456 n=1 Tax=Paramacrobiotus metropolitanus TaxID=2943436 RepID=UPI002445BF9F|nr:uncharacterized protein LOC129588456 [Paramacrobiotus metropolitanus]XP_055338638.1 uncharacterized protein LOC129588456 [Paramacrobiotus metropolitanus]